MRVIRVIFATFPALATARGLLGAGTAREKGQAGTRHNDRYDFHSAQGEQTIAGPDKRKLLNHQLCSDLEYSQLRLVNK